MHDIITTLEQLSPVWVYCALFLIAYVENLFPPSPSDVVIVFGGTLVAIGRINFIGAILCSTLGSTLGFISMYMIGRWFGDHILKTGRLKFIPLNSVQRVELWFQKWGVWVIVANRFLSGTRAVVSFFAGMSGLQLSITVPLCAVSALVWNGLLLYAGYLLGQHWEVIADYLATYSRIITAAIAVVLVVWIVYLIVKKRKTPSEHNG
jgi:membrane protein DedA with SNARE-associated domain